MSIITVIQISQTILFKPYCQSAFLNKNELIKPNSFTLRISTSDEYVTTSGVCARFFCSTNIFDVIWISSYTSVMYHGNSQVQEQAHFGGCEGFCPNFPKLARRKLQRKWPQINRLHFISIWANFSNQSTSSTILPKFTPNLPEFPLTCPKKLNKHHLQKTKHLPFEFGRHFCKIKEQEEILRRFSHTLPKFTQILPGFSLNQNLWGCACIPCTPTSYTTVKINGSAFVAWLIYVTE